VLPALFGLADREIGARKKPFRGRGWAIAALVLIAAWWGLRNAEHLHALELVKGGSLTREPLLRAAAEPRMLSPFAWHAILETQDYYQTAEVRTIGDQVDTSDAVVIYKPEVTPAVAAAKQSYLGKVYLDWSSWPLATDLGADRPPGADLAVQPDWHTVRFDDLRFAHGALTVTGSSNADPPLSGWVVVGPGNEIEGMFMSGKEQK
jgi:inner membrane protein